MEPKSTFSPRRVIGGIVTGTLVFGIGIGIGWNAHEAHMQEVTEETLYQGEVLLQKVANDYDDPVADADRAYESGVIEFHVVALGSNGTRVKPLGIDDAQWSSGRLVLDGADYPVQIHRRAIIPAGEDADLDTQRVRLQLTLERYWKRYNARLAERLTVSDATPVESYESETSI